MRSGSVGYLLIEVCDRINERDQEKTVLNCGKSYGRTFLM